MILPWVAAAALGVSWVEITAGLPPFDDITTVQFGDHPDELFVGTVQGRVWHTDDGGRTFELSFWPVESDPLVGPRLTNYRAPSLGDLARGTDRNIPARERASQAKRASDLAGVVRDRPRDRGTAVLSSLTRRVARDRVSVKYISKCPNGLYMFTSESVWRTEDKGVHWDRLSLGPMGEGNTVRWVSCSHDQPGHMVINTNGGPLESFDYGDTFGLWKNPFPKSQLLPIAGPGEDDLLFVMDEHWLYQERADGHYEVLGQIIGDSVEADEPHWTWAVPEWGMRFVVTGDGMLVLDENGTRRVNEERLARRPLRFPYVDTTVPGHVFAATENEVYESFDYAQTFEHIFTSPTERTIIRMTLHTERPGDLIVVTGGQIWRRVWDEDAQLWEPPRTTRNRVSAILRSAPLWDTVETALDRLELRPDQVAAARNNLRFRSLMPAVTGTLFVSDGIGADVDITLTGPRYRRRPGRGYDDQNIWTIFFYWDLRDFIHDPLQTSSAWVDVERLRQRITWDVQDTWARWSRSVAALEDPTMTSAQHAYHEVSRRESAAYLHHLTGGKFDAFAPDDPAGALQ